MRIATEHRKCRANGGKKRKREGGRERFDLDVWPQQQPAGDGDTRAKETQTERKTGAGGVKCLDDQIAERAIDGERQSRRRIG